MASRDFAGAPRVIWFPFLCPLDHLICAEALAKRAEKGICIDCMCNWRHKSVWKWKKNSRNREGVTRSTHNKNASRERKNIVNGVLLALRVWGIRISATISICFDAFIVYRTPFQCVLFSAFYCCPQTAERVWRVSRLKGDVYRQNAREAQNVCEIYIRQNCIEWFRLLILRHPEGTFLKHRCSNLMPVCQIAFNFSSVWLFYFISMHESFLSIFFNILKTRRIL